MPHLDRLHLSDGVRAPDSSRVTSYVQLPTELGQLHLLIELFDALNATLRSWPARSNRRRNDGAAQKADVPRSPAPAFID